MRLLCLVLAGSLVVACAPGVGAWRADGGAATDPADRIAEPRAVHRDGHGHGRLDDADEIVGCLGQAAVIGGMAAVIYLTRFRGGGGGGGGEVPAEPPPDAAPWLRAPELREAGGSAADPVAPGIAPGPGRDRTDPREAAAIVEAEPGEAGAFRPSGAICVPAPAAP